MQNKSSAKEELQSRLYALTLKLIDLVDKLPHDNVGRRLGDQLLRSGTSVLANYVEAKAASSRKDYINYFTLH